MCEGNYKNITFQIRRLEKKKVNAIMQLYFNLVSLYFKMSQFYTSISNKWKLYQRVADIAAVPAVRDRS